MLQSDDDGLLRGDLDRLRHLLPADQLAESEAMRELFVEDLKKVQGAGKWPPCKCCLPTTLACGEEANGCSGCN